MNPIESLRAMASSEDVSKDAYLYRLRKNEVLTWVDKLSNVNKYKSILQECSVFSTLVIESGIVRVDPLGRYLGHEFSQYVKAGFNFSEITTLLKAEIISFEEEYGTPTISESDLDKLKSMAYEFNRQTFYKLDMSDKKNLIHLEQTASVLGYFLSRKIILTNQVNGWCTLKFLNDSGSTKDYCTIFSEEEIALLERVNKAIHGTENTN